MLGNAINFKSNFQFEFSNDEMQKKCSLMFLNVNEKKRRKKIKTQFLINKDKNLEKINKKCE